MAYGVGLVADTVAWEKAKRKLSSRVRRGLKGAYRVQTFPSFSFSDNVPPAEQKNTPWDSEESGETANQNGNVHMLSPRWLSCSLGDFIAMFNNVFLIYIYILIG